MKKSIVLMTSLLMMTAVGCSFGKAPEVDPAEVAATTICVHSDGTLEQTILEDFSKDNYDLSELNQMINEEVSDYNSQYGADSVALTYIDLSGPICTVQLKYASSDDYVKFEQEELFVGTVKEALDLGYDLNVVLKSAKNLDETIGLSELASLGDKHIVICEDASRIRTEGKILYMSDEARFIDNYEVDGYMMDAYTIVVFK